MNNNESRLETNEQVPDESKLIDKVIGKIKSVTNRIADHFKGISKQELDQVTGDFLVSEAVHKADDIGCNSSDNSEVEESVEAVLVFGAEEQAISSVPPLENPIAKFDDHGKHRGLIVAAAEDLQEDGGVLPSGENVVDEAKLKEIIDLAHKTH